MDWLKIVLIVLCLISIGLSLYTIHLCWQILKKKEK